MKKIDKEIKYEECVIGRAEDESKNIWALREYAGIGFGPEGYCISYDFSVESTKWWDYNKFVLERL